MFRDFFENITNRLTFLDTPKPQPEAEKATQERTPDDQKKLDVRDRSKAYLDEMITRYRMEQKVDPTPAERTEFASKAVKKALEWSKAQDAAQVESTHEAVVSAGSKMEVPGFDELVAELAKGGFDLSPDKSLQKPVTVETRIKHAEENYAGLRKYIGHNAEGGEKAQGAPLITEAQEKQVQISNVLYDQVSDGMLSQNEATALFKKLEKGDPKTFAEVVGYLQVNRAVAKRIEGLQKVQALAANDPRIDGWKSANTMESKQAVLDELKTLTDVYSKSHAEAADQLASLDNSNDPLSGIL